MCRVSALAVTIIFPGVAGAATLDLWADQTEEFLDRCVPVSAEAFPRELHHSSLYYAGPSLWSLPSGQEARHSFDGLGRLHRFYHASTEDGQYLCHSARFIASPGAETIFKSCDLTSAGSFAQVAGAAWWAKLPLAGLLAANLDNTWVNQIHFAGTRRLELMTDTSEVLQADMESLDVMGKVRWNDTIVTSLLPIPPLSTAHPEVHALTGDVYNIVMDPGLTNNQIVLFRRRVELVETREEVARLDVGHRILIQHSWALSIDFALLLAHPMFMDPMKAAASGDMLGALVEQPSTQNFTRIFMVPLTASSKHDAREFMVAPFINVHVINAYRDGDRAVILDLEGRPAASEDSESFYGAFRMEHFRAKKHVGQHYFQEHFEKRAYGLYRFELPLQQESASKMPRARPLHTSPLVFPVISPVVKGRLHCFIWASEGAGLVATNAKLVKINVCKTNGDLGVVAEWSLKGFMLAAEASFVPAGDGSEDSGWLLAPVQESASGGRGALVVVEAAEMKTISMTYLKPGDVLNWGAHSTFVSAAAAPGTHKKGETRQERHLSDIRDSLHRCRSQQASDL